MKDQIYKDRMNAFIQKQKKIANGPVPIPGEPIHLPADKPVKNKVPDDAELSITPAKQTTANRINSLIGGTTTPKKRV